MSVRSIRFLEWLCFISIFQAGASAAWAAPNVMPLTILATNDIHGGVEPSKYRTTGEPIGGMSFWGGVIRSIKKSVQAQGGGVLVVDAGDQFQGTLISNTNEGDLVFSAMDEVGYDAVVPGNHDYDFGPKGWLKDRATEPGENGREVIEGLAAKVKFPLLSANTYLRESLRDLSTGQVVDVASNSCAGPSRAKIDWKNAQRPSFLKPYIIRTMGTVRVAIIGMDHPTTASMTTAVNVSDLCFRSPADTYRQVRDEIGTSADIFILVIHSANSPGKPELTEFVKSIRADAQPRLDAVIAGHTHMIQKDIVDGVPIIQSGSGGERFGRIDFTIDLAKKKLIPAKTKVVSGIALLHQRCDDSAKTFCSVTPDVAIEPSGATGQVAYDAVDVEKNAQVEQMIAAARAQIKDLAERKLFLAKAPLKRDRTRESPLADLLTDTLRQASGAEISFLNTGGIRTDLPEGWINYEQFFEVLPFGNRGVVAGPMGVEQIVQLLERSIRTCGDYGALMQSGLCVRFSRDCRGGRFDANAKLLSVRTVGGETVYEEKSGITNPGRTFTVATLDFLLDGGSGYDGFKGTPMIRDLDIAREVLTSEFLKSATPLEVDGTMDRRWYQVYTEQRSAIF